MRYVMAVLRVLFLVSPLVFTGCEEGSLLSHDQEIAMGRQAGDEFEAKYGRDRDPGVNQLLAEISQRVTAAAQPPAYPYDVRVLALQDINAVAFPGGRIYIYRGLVDNFKRNPDWLAWVLAHETAHVARHHVARRVERELGYDLIISLLVKGQDTARIAGLVANLALLNYGRDNEFEADRMGMLYAHAAGYDPTTSLGVLQRFQEIQGRDPNDLELMFMTHPGNNDRLNHARSYLVLQGWTGQYRQAGAGG